MAGPLDFLTSDDAQLGLALLGAAGPTPTPMSFGQRLAGGMQQAQAMQQAREERTLKQLLMQAQIAQTQAEADNLRGINSDVGAIFGRPGGGAMPAAPTAGGGLMEGAAPSGGLMAGPPQAAPAPGMTAGAGPAPMMGGAGPAGGTATIVPQAGLGSVPIDAIARLKARKGGPDLLQAWEIARFGKPVQPGLVQMPDGRLIYTGDPSKGLDASGRMTQGYLSDQTALAAATKGAEATAGAKYTPGEPYIDTDPNSPTYMQKILPSRLQQFGGPAAAAPAAAPAAPVRPLIATPGGYRNEGQMKGTAAISDDPVAAAQRELASIQREAPNAKDQASRAALDQRAGELRQVIASGGAGVQTETPAAYRNLLTPTPSRAPANVVELSPQQQTQIAAEKAGAIKEAEGRATAKIEREKAAATTGRQFQQMTAAADLADKLLDTGPTGSGIGALADRVGNFVGQPMKGASQAAQLKALGGWLVANVPRMEGPQSDRDVANYNIMAGQVGDETLPPSIRKAALQTVMALQRQYAAINGAAPADVPSAPAGSRSVTGAIGAPGSATKAGPSVDDLVKKYAR